MSTDLHERYRSETRRLVTRRGPTCAWLFAAGVAIASVLEYRYHPERLGHLLLFFGLELAACAGTIALYRTSRFRHYGIGIMHLACIALLACVTAYGLLTGTHPAVLAFLFIVFTFTTALMFPWGVRNQALMAGVCLTLYVGVLAWSSYPMSLLLAYGLYVLAVACLLSLLGAAYLDRQRAAIFLQRERLDQNLATFRELTRTLRGFDASRVIVLTCASLIQSFGLRRLWVVWRQEDAGVQGYLLDAASGGIAWSPLVGPEALWTWAADWRGTAPAFTLAAADAPLPLALRRAGVSTMLCLPLQTDGERRVAIFGDRGGEPLAIEERDLTLASVMASGAAIALANARLYERLTATSAEKSLALARIAHELRNPLQATLWELDGLRDLPGVPEARLEHVRGHAQMTLEMAKELQDFAEIETRSVTVHPELINLTETFEQMRAMALPLLDGRPIAFQVRVAAGAGVVLTDPYRLRQLLGNLIANAAKFTTEGSITLEAHAVGDHIALGVHDTGAGIPREECERIFAPFYRGTAVRHGRSRGMGLGLAIVQEIAALLGGRVEVESVPGEGSTFRVLLPMPAAARALAFQGPALRSARVPVAPAPPPDAFQPRTPASRRQ
jgi:signal transduction histidine kinase